MASLVESDINGGDNDYATLILWETAKDGDITAATGSDEIQNAHVKGDLSDNANDICELAGWTTAVGNYIQIDAEAADRRTSANPLRVDQGIYLLANRTGGFRQVLDVDPGAEWLRIEGLEMAVDSDSDASTVIDMSGLYESTESGYIYIANCVIAHLGADDAVGINYRQGDDSSPACEIWNTVVYNCTDGIFVASYGTGSTIDIYNCTVYGCTVDGIVRHAATVSCYNTISYNNTGDDFGGTIGGDYNMSEDATAPGANSLDSGTGGNSPVFVNTGAGTEDFQLQVTSDAIGAGTDDPGSGLYSDDINRTARTSTWDMGAHEYVAAGGISIPIVMLQHDHFDGGAIL